MVNYRLSLKAKGDLAKITKYTIKNFGRSQATHYRLQLEAFLDRLAENPYIGHTVDQTYEGLRAFPHQGHMIYYLIAPNGPFIVRILHHSMDAKRHL